MKQSPETIRKRQETRLRNHPIILTPCANCGEEKYHVPSRRKERNYCSSSCQLRYEYAHGIRDGKTIVLEAHKVTKEMLDKGIHPLQKSENRIKANRNLGRRNYGKTWIEEKMGWALTQLGVKFISQMPIIYGKDILNRTRYYFPDFAIPEFMLLIECDGINWHKDKNKDALRENKLKELGWHIIRFPEAEIKKDVMTCANQVLMAMGYLEMADEHRLWAEQFSPIIREVWLAQID